MKIDAYQQLGFLADKANIGLESILHEDKQTNLLQFGVQFCENFLKIMKGEIFIVEDTNLKSAIFDDENRNNELIKLGIKNSNIIESIENLKSDLESYISGNTAIIKEEIEKLQDKLYWLSIYFYESDVSQTNYLKEKRSLNAYG
ncbi:hypothetical protein ACFL0M_14975 [Thermodesulfobacteriota bacterium]